MFKITADESVLDSNGRVMLFSVSRFISDVAQGNACFICGSSRRDVSFNDEHVLPDWILRRYTLHGKSVTLPNGTLFRYGAFKVPCCVDCNRRMGEELEGPISKMFAAGNDAVSRELKENGPWRLFCWMSLIFLKTHLKDQYLALSRDRRNGEMKIGELHSWEELHHIHCVARAFYTGCDLASEVMGSVIVLPAKVRPHLERFDYCDLSAAQTLLLRMDETAIVAVLNDSQAALSVYYEELDKVRGPLSPLQLREIAARLAAINIHVRERPAFSSEFDFESEKYEIVARRPSECWLDGPVMDTTGKIMHLICRDMLAPMPAREMEELVEQIKTGRYTFLVDKDGNFPHDHMDLVPLA
jgi:hypothetical protein